MCSAGDGNKGGGCVSNVVCVLQVMVTKEVAESVGGLKELVPAGTSVLIEGELTRTPEGTKQVGTDH
jgi:hypothetical protein